MITAIVAAELAIMLFFSAVHIDVLMPPLLVNLSDAILLGIAASGMIYFWVVRPINQLNPSLPVLFASGDNSHDIRYKGILLESMDLIMKPVSPKDLLRKVRLALDKSMPAA